MAPGGWKLTGLAAVLLGTIAAVVLGRLGANEHGFVVLLRITAATSVLLFLLAYLASSLRRAADGAFTRWLLRNRRYVGVSFAVSHFIHLGAIVGLARTSDFVLEPGAAVGGGLAYAFIAAMTATSFDRSAAWLGPRWWNRLHRTGLHWVWVVFTFTYLGTAVEGRPHAVVFLALLLGALGFRLAVRRRRGRRRAAAAPA